MSERDAFQFAWLVAVLDVIATSAVLCITFVIVFLIPPIAAYSWEILTGMMLFTVLALVGFVFMVNRRCSCLHQHLFHSLRNRSFPLRTPVVYPN